MLRLLAVLAVFAAGPALAQTVTDGSARAVPPDLLARMNQELAANPDFGASAQLSKLHVLKSDNHVYVCGLARVGGKMQIFYYDSFSGAARVGPMATSICVS